MFAIVEDAAFVGDSAVRVRVIAVRAAVFGDFDGKLVIFRDALNDVVQTTGVDLPADLGEWAIFSHGDFKAHCIVSDFGGNCGRGSRDDAAEVIVNADIVEGS